MNNTNISLSKFYDIIASQTPLQLKYQFICKLIYDDGASGWPEFSLLCQSANIPKRTMNSTDVNFFGKKFQMPGTEKFEHEWTSKLILTQDLEAYEYLKSWMLRYSSLKNNSGRRKNYT